MMTTTIVGYVTADEFLRDYLDQPGELVRGQVRLMTPASGRHGMIAGRVLVALANFVNEHKLGECFSDNTGFQLPGLVDTVRSPDAAFVSTARLPKGGIGNGWVPVAPDLAVEILSPSETRAMLEEKLVDYFAAGTRVVWIVDPARRHVTVRREASEQIVDAGTIAVEDILPGFALDVLALFVGLAR